MTDFTFSCYKKAVSVKHDLKEISLCNLTP